MADKKITQLSGASTPLAGTELVELVQGGTNVKATAQDIADLAGGGGIPFATASGTDTYTATITGVTSYADGDAYLIRFTNGNTSSATLNINSLGAIALYRNNDGALIGGDIWADGEMLCVYDSTLTAFKCIGTSPNSIFAYVTNDQGSAITKGQVVYAFSGTGDRMTVKLANNTADATSAKTVGVVYSSSIGINQKGIIILQGLLDGLSILPTSTYSDGDSIYLGATDGAITNVKPYAPNHLVYVATVTTASNGSSGRMYVRVQNGYELDELHNVQAQSPTLKDTLWYDNTVSPAQWKTASISTILGYTPEDVANKSTTTTLGTSNTLYPTQNAVKTYVDSGTTTLTNKRITARTGTVASSATPTINTDNVDYYSITALAVAITSMTTNLSGTPTTGQTLWISITDNGTARAITWGASFEASGNVALPTTTVISTRLDVAFIWNEATSKWRCVGVA
jgi:hypothetical protein